MLKRHTFIYLFAHGLPALLGFVALIAYTHLAAPHEYGIYVVGSTIGTFLSLAAFSWIRFSVTRYQSETEHADVRVTAAIAYAGAALVLALGLGVAALLFAGSMDTRLAAGAVFFALAAGVFEITQEHRRARLNPGRFFAASAIRSVLGFGFGLAAIIAGFGGHGLFLAISISYLAGALLFVGSTWAGPLARFDPATLRKFAAYGVPFAVSGLLFAAAGLIDRLVVAHFLGEGAAGQYGAAGDLARQTVLVVSMSVASAIFPIAFRNLGTKGADATSLHLRESAELFFAIVSPIALLLALGAGAFSATLVGAEYAGPMAMLLPILAGARFLGAVSSFYIHISFQLAQKPMLQVVNGVAIVSASVALAFFLIPRFGLMGAAAASLIAEIVGVMMGLWLSRYAFVLPWAPGRLLRVGACLLVAAVAARAVEAAPLTGLLGLVAVVGIGAAGYGLTAFLLDVAGVRAFALRVWPALVTRLSAR